MVLDAENPTRDGDEVHADPAVIDDLMARAERTLDATGEPGDPVSAARAAADAYSHGPHTTARGTADHDALSMHRMCVRSEGLRRLISEGVALKSLADDRALQNTKAAVFASELVRLGAPQAAIEAAKMAEAVTQAAWELALDDLNAAALRVSTAPFGNLQDILDRADAYARLVGTREDNTPDCDEDIIAMGASYRAALQEMAQRLPGADDFGDAVSVYRNVQHDLRMANRELEARERGLMDNEADVLRKIDRLEGDRAEAQNAILAERPGDLDGLLVQMEVVFDQAFHLDVETYAVRQRVLTEDGENIEPLAVGDLRTDDGRRRALALLANNVARLRDKDMASDWRELAGSFGLCHPNAPDAVRRAYDAGMDVKALTIIQLANRPEEELPTLTFQSEGRYHIVNGHSAWRGEAVK